MWEQFYLFACFWVKFVIAVANGQLDVQMHLVWIIFSTELKTELFHDQYQTDAPIQDQT